MYLCFIIELKEINVRHSQQLLQNETFFSTTKSFHDLKWDGSIFISQFVKV